MLCFYNPITQEPEASNFQESLGYLRNMSRGTVHGRDSLAQVGCRTSTEAHQSYWDGFLKG